MAGALFQIHVCSTCRMPQRRPHSADPAPLCCGTATKWVRTQTLDFPAVRKLGHAPGIDFRHTSPIEVPIGQGGMRFESLAELRKFERESEAMAADGIGQPHVIRGYSQNPSNMHVHTMGENPDQRPDLTRTHRDGTPRVRVTSADAPTFDDATDPDFLGPGITPGGASPLDSTP